MTKLKNGDPCYVSDLCEQDALDDPILCTFIGMNNSQFICHTLKEGLIGWEYAIPVPEKKTIEWTFETCPLPPFTVKQLGIYKAVTTLLPHGVAFSEEDYVSFKELHDGSEYIPDRNNRHKTLPCGLEVGK